MDIRLQELQEWLAEQLPRQRENFSISPLAGDASFRRYFRVQHANGTFIAMDAKPPTENCQPFVAIAKALMQQGLLVPQIFASDLLRGYLLLSDLGDNVLLKSLNPNNAKILYQRALDNLSILQDIRYVPEREVPSFTKEFMLQELIAWQEWFLQKHLQLTLTVKQTEILKTTYDIVTNAAITQPQVFMHRDYHAGNLMVLPNHDIGILDFQDAFIGPITYDVVSLLRDCYIDWPATLVTELVLYYYQLLNSRGILKQISPQQFLYWFDLMGIQRHLKAILTFARKHHRDHNPNYLPFIPRTLNYIATISRQYPKLENFNHFLQETVYPAWKKVENLCAL